MKRYEFPYLKQGSRYFPVVDITLKYKKSEITLKALVDSCATHSVFRHEVADYLGLAFAKGKLLHLEGISGRIAGYMHTLDVVMGGISYKNKIVFSRQLKVSFNILGRDNFFEPFLITFCETDKKVVIRKA
ncbi:MAG: hypothetical protein A2Y00_08985 [Omnitrophica WOR_2 bacterium GWF2_43_52]|nr:MAG: hypothetical protein A2062_07230 [Omnitrophica WOR_2 bacterium GWA2_44_7]OGX14353.1 MAG: hypothetical protein A2Y01_06630 [Omnitrophica WOR_2 bacterium GWC2_44_8]OGX21700.1 MAG: hypothetical protein A2Y00_08985 [Omnitrophica WOR_2 bacterium GWF2_43_52]HAH19975.1 hypothetical protein [Candidatus Omnitrophota bacterium]HBG63140.1 hypothetical protein [Candidatus Omnitrophota bacterium]